MCLCLSCKKKNKNKEKTEHKMNRKDSRGELIFEDIQNLRMIAYFKNSKIEGNIVNRAYNI